MYIYHIDSKDDLQRWYILKNKNQIKMLSFLFLYILCNNLKRCLKTILKIYIRVPITYGIWVKRVWYIGDKRSCFTSFTDLLQFTVWKMTLNFNFLYTYSLSFSLFYHLLQYQHLLYHQHHLHQLRLWLLHWLLHRHQHLY